VNGNANAAYRALIRVAASTQARKTHCASASFVSRSISTASDEIVITVADLAHRRVSAGG
jgi:hypothetical protein